MKLLPSDRSTSARPSTATTDVPATRARAHEMPETDQVGPAYAAMRAHLLPQPASSAYLRVVRTPKQRERLENLMLLVDPRGAIADSLERVARRSGWLRAIDSHEASVTATAAPAAGAAAWTPKLAGTPWLHGALARLLYEGRIDDFEFATASVLMALWRDSQAAPVPPAPFGFGSLSEYAGAYVSWQDALTVDATTSAGRSFAAQAHRFDAENSGHESAFVQEFVDTATALEARHSPDRFVYYFPVLRDCAFPTFGLGAWQPGMPFRLVDPDRRALLPVTSLTLMQLASHTLERYPITIVPSMGAISVAGMQAQVLAGERPFGLSLPIPGRPTSRLLEADGFRTGEAAASWHDVQHLRVSAAGSPRLRRQLVELHRHLTQTLHEHTVPATIGPVPFAKLLHGALFSFTDQNSFGTVNPEDAMLGAYTTPFYQPLSQIIEEGDFAPSVNLRRHLFAHLEPGRTYDTAQPDGAFLREVDDQWTRFANVLLRASLDFLHAQEVHLTHAVPAGMVSGRQVRRYYASLGTPLDVAWQDLPHSRRIMHLTAHHTMISTSRCKPFVEVVSDDGNEIVHAGWRYGDVRPITRLLG